MDSGDRALKSVMTDDVPTLKRATFPQPRIWRPAALREDLPRESCPFFNRWEEHLRAVGIPVLHEDLDRIARVPGSRRRDPHIEDDRRRFRLLPLHVRSQPTAGERGWSVVECCAPTCTIDPSILRRPPYG